MDCRKLVLQALRSLLIITPLLTNVSPQAAAQSYCSAGAKKGTFESIALVQINTIDNGSDGQSGYEDFTSLSTNLQKGQTYSFSIGINTAFDDDQLLIWIDLNHDGDFTDPGETVFTSPVSAGPYDGNFFGTPW